jgi:outer membrane protein assembly factor BamD (BamD/ComL family)
MRKLLFLVLIGLMAGFSQCGKKLSDQELMNKAREAEAQGKAKDALKYYEELVDRFPNSNQHALALFMAGFLNANSDTKDLNKARKYYMDFKAKYPQHELTKSVDFELQNLGRDPGEMLALPDRPPQSKN